MSARLLRPRASSAFNPKSLFGLAVWLDAADSSTVSTSSNAITEITNKSGNGLHATQTIANNRPSYQTATRNGRNVARFDGSNDFLSVTTTFTQGPFSVFVATAHTANRFQGIVCERNSTTPAYFGCTYFNNGNVAISRLGQAGTQSALTMTTDAMGIAVWLSDGMSSGTVACTARRNGAQNASDISIGSLLSNPNAVSIGSGGLGNTDQFIGDIGEVVVYNRRLSLLETQRIEQYLARKWGVTLA
jgi:hypothetical protein